MSFRSGQKLKRRKRSSAKSLWDEGKEINVAVKTGKVLLGQRSVVRELSMGELKLIVIARNAPEKVVNQIKILNNCLEKPVPVYTSKNSSWELGALCARPHWVSVVGVINPGDSSILKAVENQ